VVSVVAAAVCMIGSLFGEPTIQDVTLQSKQNVTPSGDNLHPMKWWLTSALALSVVVLAALFLLRWQITPGPRDNYLGEPTALRLDRWTGEIVTCGVKVTPGWTPGPGKTLECD
jgi:hypothetical protein